MTITFKLHVQEYEGGGDDDTLHFIYIFYIQMYRGLAFQRNILYAIIYINQRPLPGWQQYTAKVAVRLMHRW